MLNPILEREIKSKMRSWRMPIAIVIYLFFMGLVTYLGMSLMSFSSMRAGFDPQAAANIYDFISVFQLGLIMFIVPLVTATSISGERERQTLDLMLCTDFPIMSIIYGKMLSGLSTVLLLMVMATPFLSVSFVLGGIGILDVLKTILYYAISALYISTISLYASTKFRRNITAIIMTYVIMGILYVTPFILFLGLSLDVRGAGLMSLFEQEPYIMSALFFGANPGYGMLSLMSFSDLAQQLNSQILPSLSRVPTWIISFIWFAIISFIMLKLAKKNLKAKG
ncbi:MAG: hypothetical protein Q4A72_00820 [Bacillota bacterium]|nr:hypothetical protein [Bacillota bacterium]